MDLKMVPCASYDDAIFVRDVRFHPDNLYGYVHNESVSNIQQAKYMQEHRNEYWICMADGERAGFVGVVKGDLRIGVHPDYQRQGVGTFMMEHLAEEHGGEFSVRVKKTNDVSMAFFKSLGYEPEFYVMVRRDPE